MPTSHNGHDTSAPEETEAQAHDELDNGGLNKTVATVVIVAAGAALFEAALLPGIAIGVAAVAAPKYLPKLAGALNPLFKSTVRGTYKFAQKSKEMFAEAHEQVNDIVAEVKAESDLCCTSANAAQIVASVPADREVLFLPDQFLGAHVRRVTGRANLHVWLGECHVHAGISPAELRRKASADPAAELFIHPECGCSTAALWQAGEGDLPPDRTRVLSTGGMLEAARSTRAPRVLVATETGMLHQLRRANPAVRWEPVNPGAVCRFMKMTTPAALLRCLREGVTEVTVDPGVARRARRAVQAMLTAGSSPAPAGVTAP